MSNAQIADGITLPEGAYVRDRLKQECNQLKRNPYRARNILYRQNILEELLLNGYAKRTELAQRAARVIPDFKTDEFDTIFDRVSKQVAFLEKEAGRKGDSNDSVVR